MNRELQISALAIDPAIQCRNHTDEATIADYAADYEAGATFPPVEVIQEGATLWLVDGFHRVEAASRISRLTIQANVVPGTRQDAAWAACGANRTHGLKRTNADKRKAAEAALRLRPEQSDRWIADHVGVSPTTVAKVRESLTVQNGQSDEMPDDGHGVKAPANLPPPIPQRSRRGRDGRKIDTTRIGRPSKARPKPIRRVRVSESEPDDSPRRFSAYAIANLQNIDPADPVGAEELRRVRDWIDRILGDIDD